MSKSKLALLILSAVVPFARADDAPTQSFQAVMQAATEGLSSPVWKDGWTAPVYSTVLESCAKGFFVNVMKNAHPQSWWPAGPSATKIPSGMLWAYAASDQPELLKLSFLTCLCTTETMARVLKYSDVPAFVDSTKASELANECVKNAAPTSATSHASQGK